MFWDLESFFIVAAAFGEKNHLKISQGTGPVFQATGLRRWYLKLRGWNLSIARYLKLRGWYLKPWTWYLKLRGWNLSISRYLKVQGRYLKLQGYGDGISSYGAGIWVSQGILSYGAGISSHGPGISSYGAGIWVSQGISRYRAGISSYRATEMVSQATGLEFEYLKVSQATGLVFRSKGNKFAARETISQLGKQIRS